MPESSHCTSLKYVSMNEKKVSDIVRRFPAAKKLVPLDLAWDKDPSPKFRPLLPDLTISLPRAEDIMTSFGDLRRVSPPPTKPNTPNLS